MAEQYAQVGNAVPPRLGQVAGEVIAKTLSMMKRRTCEPRLETNPDPRIVYLQSHVRTRSWYKNGETIIWDSDEDDGGGAGYAAPKTLRRTRKLET